MASNPRRRSSTRYDDRMRIETRNLEQQYKERDEEIQKKKQDHMERLEERIRSTQNLTSLPRGKSSPSYSSVAAKSAATAGSDAVAGAGSSASSSSTPRSSSLTGRLVGSTATPSNTPRSPTRSSLSNESTPRGSSSTSLSSPTRARSPSSSISSTSYSAVVTGGSHHSSTTTSTTTTTTSYSSTKSSSSVSSSSSSTYRARSPSYSPTSSRYSARTTGSGSSTYVSSSTPIYKEVPVVRKPSRAAQEINSRPSPALQSPRGMPSPKPGSPKASPRKTPSSSPKVSPRADQSLYSIRSFCDIPEVTQTPSNPSSPRPGSPTKRQRRNSTRGRNSPRRNSNAAPPVMAVEQTQQQQHPFLHGLHIRSKKVEMKSCFMAHAAEDQVFIWDLAAEQCVTVFQSHTATVTSVSMFTWEASGVTLVASSSSEETLIWDAATGAVVKALPGAHFSSVFYYANQSNDSPKPTASARRQPPGALKLAIPKLHILICHNVDIEIWDFEKAECVKTLRGHKARVNVATLMHASLETPRGTSVAVATAAKKALVISASADGSMRVWDLATGDCEKTLWHCDVNSVAGVDAMSVSDAGRLAVSVSADERTLKVWDLQPPYNCVLTHKLKKGCSELVSLFVEDSKLDAHMDASANAISVMQTAREKSEIMRFAIDDNASVVLVDRNNITVGTASGEPFFCYKN